MRKDAQQTAQHCLNGSDEPEAFAAKMDIFEKIKIKAAQYRGLSCKVDGDTLSVIPMTATGFSVRITVNHPGFTVSYDGWHEEFEKEDDALNCFAFGLSDECRLKVVKRGDADCTWVVESKDGTDWHEDSRTGLVFVPFWKKKSVEYRQNNVIKTSEPAAAAAGGPSAQP